MESVKNVKITRKSVITALLNEPLVAGIFVRTRKEAKKDHKPCGVCAVGSVLRHCGFNAKEIDSLTDSTIMSDTVVADSEYEVEQQLTQGNWLNALSCKFELMAKQLAKALDKPDPDQLTPKETAILRKPLVAWVKDNLPQTLGKIRVTKGKDSWNDRYTEYEVINE